MQKYRCLHVVQIGNDLMNPGVIVDLDADAAKRFVMLGAVELCEDAPAAIEPKAEEALPVESPKPKKRDK